jgi:hypothetical protein
MTGPSKSKRAGPRRGWQRLWWLAPLTACVVACASGGNGEAPFPEVLALDPDTGANSSSGARDMSAVSRLRGDGPAIEALRPLQGRVPLVYLARGPWPANQPNEPAYEVAAFEDGTLLYEGHRCVKVGGITVKRLDPYELRDLREMLARSCGGFKGAPSSEVCIERGALKVTCTNGDKVVKGTDRCSGNDQNGKALNAFAEEVLDNVDLASAIGEPTERQGCEIGAEDMAPGEISRLLSFGGSNSVSSRQ